MSDVMQIIVLGLVGLGVVFSIIRLLVGPTVADRLVGLDTLNIIIIGVVSLLAVIFKNKLYLDIAIVYGILAFLETIVFSRYLEGENHANIE